MKFRKVTSDIFVIEDLMPKEICQTYIQLSENIGYQPAALQFGKTRVVRENVRNNLSIDHRDTSLATALWELCGGELPQTSPYGRAVGLNDEFRFYKYQSGMRFMPHRDGIVSKSISRHSYYTFMVYLNEDFEGGETSFENYSMSPKTGSALIFTHSLLHEGSEVSAGTKYVLRSEVLYEIAGV